MHHGFSGHLTLGQASIAGLGAFFTARATNGIGIGIGEWELFTLQLPVLLAMVFGASVSMLAGLAAGYPALRRKGLFLGLTTLGLALIIDRFVFNTQIFQGPPGSLTVVRPSIFGIDLSGDTAFYFYELTVVALMFALARNLRSGRLGRVLAAMRDSETARPVGRNPSAAGQAVRVRGVLRDGGHRRRPASIPTQRHGSIPCSSASYVTLLFQAGLELHSVSPLT